MVKYAGLYPKLVVHELKTTKPIKMAIIGPKSPPPGGIATFIENLCQTDFLNFFQVAFFHPSHHSPRYSGVFGRTLSKIIMYCHFVSFIRQNHISIVYIHTSSYSGFWVNSIFLLIAKALGKQTGLHIHGGGFKDFYASSSWSLKKIIKLLLRIPTILFVLSIN